MGNICFLGILTGRFLNDFYRNEKCERNCGFIEHQFEKRYAICFIVLLMGIVKQIISDES